MNDFHRVLDVAMAVIALSWAVGHLGLAIGMDMPKGLAPAPDWAIGLTFAFVSVEFVCRWWRSTRSAP